MIYFHIPFCKQKCSYCNFHFSTSLNLKKEMLSAMKKEIQLRKEELGNKNLSSLYFGGGTPSVLSVVEIQDIIHEVLKYFIFKPNIEITLEANPDDLNAKFLKELSRSEINRLSIGVQSFFDEDLKLMNRAHNASQVDTSIKRSQDLGFENISIDLIYGTPSSYFETWKDNLNIASELLVPHISSYALTVEPKTALEHWIEKGKVKVPDEEVQSDEFLYMSQFLKSKGFDHYEISNFGKPGFYSNHNISYWKYREYLGIGPSAHSYNGCEKRSWNIANNAVYIKKLHSNKLPTNIEVLTEKEQFNEMIMIGLRTMWGVDVQKLNAEFSKQILDHFRKEIEPKIESGILKTDHQYLYIPEEYWFHADGIAADLFIL